MTGLITATLFPLLMVLAGIGDFLTYRIPNWLSLLVAGLFFPAAFMAGMPLETFGWHVLAGFCALVIGFGLFAAGWFGGGDAKLLGAAALWFGWPDSMRFVVYTVLAGGVLALAVGMWSALQVDREVRGWTRFKSIFELKPNVPYGVALAAGALLALPGTWLMQSAS
jgi:prepilin peptidase CpaA